MDNSFHTDDLYLSKGPSCRKINVFQTQKLGRKNSAANSGQAFKPSKGQGRYTKDVLDESISLRSGGSDIEKFIGAIQSLWSAKNFVYRSEVSKSLHRLRHACAEDEIELSSESAQWFVDFIRENDSVNRPLLAVTDGGRIRATWKGEKDQHFAMEFFSTHLVRFVLFSPDVSGSVMRIAGAVPRRQTKTLIRQLKINWI